MYYNQYKHTICRMQYKNITGYYELSIFIIMSWPPIKSFPTPGAGFTKPLRLTKAGRSN